MKSGLSSYGLSVRPGWLRPALTLLGLAAVLLSSGAAHATTGSITQFPTSLAANSGPIAITASPQGDLWFAEYQSNRISRITVEGTVTAYPIPTPNSSPRGVAADLNGDIWFTEMLGNKVGYVDHHDGTITEFTLPAEVSGPRAITRGPDGAFWFISTANNRIGRITTSGTVTHFLVPTASSGLSSIVTGPDNNLWFTESNQDKIGRITPGGAITEFTGLSAGSGPLTITAGSDGNLWFTQYNGNRIGKMSTDGVLLEDFQIPNPASLPTGIAAGPDGKVWFTQAGSSTISSVTPGGTFTDYPGPPASSLASSTVVGGPDGNIWFTLYNTHKIGRLWIDKKPAAVTGSAGSVTGSSVTFEGSVNPGGLSTSYYFEYGKTTAYGSLTQTQDAGSGDLSIDVSESLSGLEPGTTYHYRLVATNALGTATGSDKTFTTLSKPVVLTGAASSTTDSSTTVGGSVNPSGSVTSYYFEYGKTTAYGSLTQAKDAGSGDLSIDVSESLSGLEPGTTYHYRLVATSSVGTTVGTDQTFATTMKDAPPAATSQPSVSAPVPTTPQTTLGTVPPAVSKCKVPKLLGSSLTKAKKLIKAAKCRLGKVSTAKSARRFKKTSLVVTAQSLKAGLQRPANTTVKIVLGKKKK